MIGFQKFLLRGNLVDLAVAVVIGVAFTALVNALVKDLITPLIAAIAGKPDFAGLYFTVNGSRFLYGEFLNAILAFMLIAAVVYFLVIKPYTALQERGQGANPSDPATRACPECLSQIATGARRCPFCTTALPLA